MEIGSKAHPGVLGALPRIKEEASASPAREVCGLITCSGAIHPIRNISSNPHDFVFSKQDYYEALNRIKKAGDQIACVYHSHLNGDPTPSQNDLAAIKNMKLDYLIVAGSAYTYTEYC